MWTKSMKKVVRPFHSMGTKSMKPSRSNYAPHPHSLTPVLTHMFSVQVFWKSQLFASSLSLSQVFPCSPRLVLLPFQETPENLGLESKAINFCRTTVTGETRFSPALLQRHDGWWTDSTSKSIQCRRLYYIWQGVMSNKSMLSYHMYSSYILYIC